MNIWQKISSPERAFIIAEIGSNHNQSFALACELINAAKEAGADAVKFQSINLEKLYFDPSDSIRELYGKIELQEAWHHDLKAYCDRQQIHFFSSPTYLKAVDILEETGVEFYKLASAQVGTFPQLVEKVAQLQKPVVLSTGIVRYSELERTVRIFHQAGNAQFVILHCNSIYPVPYKKVHLQQMQVYAKMFNCPVGFSDHTDNIYASLAAVTMGAAVIERHFTIDKTLPVPDAAISILPFQFQEMVAGIRAVEAMKRDGDRTEIEEEEAEFKESIRYRLILKTAKKTGDAFERDDFRFLRHGTGVDCRELETVLQYMQARHPLPAGSLLRWSDLEGKNA